MFQLEEVKGDLFGCSSNCSLGHCVSEDLHMGKGIAVLFKNKFGGVDQLRKQGKKSGDVAVLKHGSRFIYYLVTKERYFHKPTYISLESSLCMMMHHCVENGVKQLAIPRIGCGLDGLQWPRVRDLIKSVFSKTDMTITVYSL